MQACVAWHAALRTCVGGGPVETAHPLSDVCRVSFIYCHLCSGDEQSSAVAYVSGASLSAEATDEEQIHHKTAGCGHTTKKNVERRRDGETSVSQSTGEPQGLPCRDRSVTTQRPGRFKIQKSGERHKCTTAVKLTWTPTPNRRRDTPPEVLLYLWGWDGS